MFGTRFLAGLIFVTVLASVLLALVSFFLPGKFNSTANTAPALTPTPSSLVPIEAFNRAIDRQADVARYGFEAVGVVATTNAAAEISQNCLVGVGLLSFAIVCLLIFSMNKHKVDYTE